MKLFILLVCGFLCSSVDAVISKWETPMLNGPKGEYEHMTDILETTAINTDILTVKAVKADDTSTGITYTLATQSPAEAFQITTLGVISTKTELDFEAHQSYTIEIEAKEDSETATATATITLNVGNVGPEFPQASQTVCATQGSSAGTVITTLMATSEDEGDIKYSITTSTDLFAIGQSTGEVAVATEKTLNQIQQYKLTIQATDDVDPATTELIIDVKGTCSSASMLSPLSIVLLFAALMVSLN